MLNKIVLCFAALILSVAPMRAADTLHPTVNFSVPERAAIPGKTLAPGKYSIHVVDHLSDRYILLVTNAAGQREGLFIGIPNNHLPQGSKGEVNWQQAANGTTYLRGWAFPTLPTSLEFAYPKADAVAIAKANKAQVPAIDPESEGMVSNTGLSKQDMQVITLWLLSPTHVGPNAEPGIDAKRYQQVASISHKPAIAKLPHTASMLPWVFLVGALSFFGALGLRLTRAVQLR